MKTQAFDWKNSPLEGRFLIEASAGTGKTFSLIRFIVRLLMEGEQPAKIDEILAVTFTVAATAELKKRLKELLLTIRQARETDDIRLLEQEDLDKVYKKWNENGWLDDSRLDDAIAGLADAQVFTIHGFCQTMLSENEFSGSSGFDYELGDDGDIRKQCAEDFLSRCMEKIDTPELKAQLAIRDARWDQKLERINGQARFGEGATQIRFFDYEKVKDEKGKDVLAPLNEDLKEKLLEFLNWAPAELIERKKRERLCTFTDLLTLMLERLENPNFAHSVRKRYKAVLIDEFQDTDPVQYNIFKALFLNNVEQNECPSTVVFVGDPKQSIYLFRDADIKTYEKAKTDLGDTRSLNNNYRSSPILLSAFNTFFQMQKKGTAGTSYFNYEDVTGAQDKLPLMRRQPDGSFSVVPVLSIWTDSDQEHSAEELRNIEAQNIVSDICSLLDGQVFKGNGKPLKAGDIAILVRKYKDSEALLPLLRKHGIEYQLDCDEDVFKTEEAQEILDILKAMDTPDDIKRVNWARASRIFHESMNTIVYGRIKPKENALTVTEAESDAARSKARSALIHASETFSRYGISAAFSELFIAYRTEEQILAEPDGEAHLTNYRHILELLQQANAERRSLSALLRWYAKEIANVDNQTPETRKVRLGSAKDRISVMSIHKSKGLEFPVVYLAGAFNKPEGSQTSVSFRQTDESGTTLWLSHKPMNAEWADKVLEKSGLKSTFVADEISENARIAYVAMTRASQRLVLPLLTGKGYVRCNNAYLRLMRGGEAKARTNDTDALIEQFKKEFTVHFYQEEKPGEKLPEVLRSIKQLTQKEPTADEFVESVEIQQLQDLPTIQKVSVSTDSFKTGNGIQVKPSWVKTSFTSITRNAKALDISQEEGRESDEEPDQLGTEKISSTQTSNAFFSVKNAATFGDLVHQMFEKADFEKAREAKLEGSTARNVFKKLAYDRLKLHEEWLELEDTLVNTVLTTLTRSIYLDDNNKFSLADLKKENRTAEMEFTITVNAKATAENLKDLLSHFDPKYHITEIQNQDLSGFMTGFIDLAFTHNGQFWVLDWKTNKRGIKKAGEVTDSWIASQMKEHHYTLQYLIYLVALKRYLASIGINKIPQGAIYVFISAAVEHDPKGNQGLWIDPVAPSLIECLDDFFTNGYNESKIKQAARLAAKGM